MAQVKNVKKVYVSNPVYVSLHDRMRLLLSTSEEFGVSYELHFVSDGTTSDFYVPVTSETAHEFIDFTLAPDSLVSIYTLLCTLSGKFLSI